MIHPGSNILNIAMGVIATQRVTWHEYAGRTTDAMGVHIAAYSAPRVIRGSWQPVNRARYEALGLDFAKRYYMYFTSNPVRGVYTGRSADLIDYRGRRHEVVDVQPWDAEDGWSQVLVVDVSDTSKPVPLLEPAP